LIDAEARKGVNGLIHIKVNGLTDIAIIDSLYRASQQGATVRLIVRGLCCLRPGVEGLSDNITVRSVVGEFLEHSRVFVFGQLTDVDVLMYIGSADLMERNLDRRIEVLVPIENPRLQASIAETLSLLLSDDTFSWVLGTDRRWRRVVSVNQRSAQSELKTRALHKAGIFTS
jgi:polyphosphate kinase